MTCYLQLPLQRIKIYKKSRFKRLINGFNKTWKLSILGLSLPYIRSSAVIKIKIVLKPNPNPLITQKNLQEVVLV